MKRTEDPGLAVAYELPTLTVQDKLVVDLALQKAYAAGKSSAEKNFYRLPAEIIAGLALLFGSLGLMVYLYLNPFLPAQAITSLLSACPR